MRSGPDFTTFAAIVVDAECGDSDGHITIVCAPDGCTAGGDGDVVDTLDAPEAYALPYGECHSQGIGAVYFYYIFLT